MTKFLESCSLDVSFEKDDIFQLSFQQFVNWFVDSNSFSY